MAPQRRRANPLHAQCYRSYNGRQLHYGMLLTGLGLLGCMTRRHNKQAWKWKVTYEVA